MRVAIIGFSIEGVSALRYYQKQGADITVCDQDEKKIVPEGVTVHLGEHYLDDLDQFDVIVRSAGILPSVILDKNPTVANKITTTIDEFLRVCPTKHTIGITGTKGKGTTSTLTTKMLEAAGKRVFLGGNIGLSPFDFLDELTEDDWVVLELSSFQLTDIKSSTHIAVCLMVVPEHLNWHADMDDYIAAKSNLFKHQTINDIAISFADNEISQQIAHNSPGKQLAFFGPTGAHVEATKIVINDMTICDVSEIKLLGEHNWQNACAAITAVWQEATQNVEAIRNILTTFTGLPHRIAFVRELNDIAYYDDSFGTTPETAIVAMESFKQPKVIILGGADKGIPFDGLAKAVTENNVRTAVVIGTTGPIIADALRAHGFTDIVEGGTTMQQIVHTAQAHAQEGDIVLLSTGCASFGLFADYKDRGNQFIREVEAL